jgi:hypothetical protein
MDRPLIWFGLALVVMGVLVVGLGLLAGHLGRGGRLLPGDIVISRPFGFAQDRPGFTFVFPIVTGIVLSVVLTLVLWIVVRLRR